MFLCSTERSNGALWFDDIQNRNYCGNLCCDPGTIIEMTLNMDKSTIQYKTDNVECEEVEIASLSGGTGYRLAVTFDRKGDEIELI